jgi:pimeloyl-ACP methyl ester carboxylesterase
MSFAEVDGRRFEYLDLPAAHAGSPEMLLLHEGLGSVSMWRDFPERLARETGARVIAYSRLGFGRSSPRTAPYTPRFMHEEAQGTLPALRRALDIRRPVMVGHSTGASMGLLHAAHDPLGVAGVVAMAPLIDVEQGNVRSIREAKRLFETTDWPAKLARHHEQPVHAVFASWSDTWLDPEFHHWTIAPDLAAIRCPILAILGEDDPYSTAAQLEALAAHAVHASSVERMTLAACGHAPHREATDAVLAAIARWARPLAPQPA